MNRLSSSFPRPLWRAPLSLTALALAAAGLCAHAQTPPREPSIPYVVKGSDKMLLLGRQLLTNPSDWSEVARFNKLKDPN